MTNRNGTYNCAVGKQWATKQLIEEEPGCVTVL